VENSKVIEGMVNGSVPEIVLNLCLDSLLNEKAKNTWLILDIFLNLRIDFVEEIRERTKECGSEKSNVLYQILHFSRTVADSEPEHDCITVAYLFRNMGQWHIAQINIIRTEVKTEIVLRYLARNQIEMSEHRAFWLTGCSRSDSEEENTVSFWFLLLNIWQVSAFRDQV